jgi:hypothetical protein
MGIELALLAASTAASVGSALNSANAQKKAMSQQQAMAADAAAKTQADEDARQNKIKLGKDAIDSNFAQFNDSYYDDYANKYKAAYDPEIDRQYASAQDKLKANLTGRGILESGVGAQAMADLARENTTNKTAIAGQAVDGANALRSKVDGTKSNLYNLNQSAGDPAQITAQATGQATSLAAPQNYSPLGDIFANFLNNYSTNANAKAYASGGFTSPFASIFQNNSQGGKSSSSSKVVS